MYTVHKIKNNILTSKIYIINLFHAFGGPPRVLPEAVDVKFFLSALPGGSCGELDLLTAGEAPYMGCYLTDTYTPLYLRL